MTAPLPFQPFTVHTALMGQLQTMLGGGNPTALATLTFTQFPALAPVAVTHTEVMGNFVLMSGRSSETAVERCEFKVSDVQSAFGNQRPDKGWLVTLQVNPNVPPLAMQLWSGGLQPGGEIYRFMLVSENYKG